MKKTFADLRALDAKIDDRINLGKRFPGYFNKTVFRIMTVLMFLVVFIAGQESQWNFKTMHTVYCDSEKGCDNPYYVCNPPSCVEWREVWTPCPSGMELSVLCTQKHLLPGERIGEEAPWMMRNGVAFILLIVLGALCVNHTIYKVKKR